MADTSPNSAAAPASKPKPVESVEDCHQLIVWMMKKLDKFPQVRRYTLGSRIENAALDVLEALNVSLRTPHDQLILDLCLRFDPPLEHPPRRRYSAVPGNASVH
jgi:hypothetical protein